jgi:hypothetical protein
MILWPGFYEIEPDYLLGGVSVLPVYQTLKIIGGTVEAAVHLW